MSEPPNSGTALDLESGSTDLERGSTDLESGFTDLESDYTDLIVCTTASTV